MRLGFVTAPIPLWQKIVYHQQVTSMHASALSQVELFDFRNKDFYVC
jgi:DNA-binding transcriptional MocR family regulator